jgi:FlaA1/EpsC-like NDP-sugar epimerase
MNLKGLLISSSRLTKKLLALSIDFISISLGILCSLYINNYLSNYETIGSLVGFIWIPVVCLFTFWYAGVYRSIVRYIDFSVVFSLSKAIIIALLINFIVLILYTILSDQINSQIKVLIFDARIWLTGFMVATILVIGSRLFANFYLSERKYEKKVVIYGAGSAGIQLASALRVSTEMQPIAFIDNNSSLHDTFLGGIKVLAPAKLEKLTLRKKVDEVLIAIPSASRSTLRSLLKDIEKYSVKVRILPGLAELAQGKVSVSELKEVDISDLLGRYEVEANQNLINKNIKDKVVLITGAGGSIGSEISRQAAKNKPKKIIILDSNEYSLYKIRNELEGVSGDFELYTLLASVTNEKRMTEICETFQVDTIYHSAAYKHVSLVE